MNKDLEIKFDLLSFAALVLTFISIAFSLKLSSETTILAIGVFLIIIATYAFLIFKDTINSHAKEIKKLNEKINIYKDLSDLKARVDIIFHNMGKRGNTDVLEIFIRLIQIAAILFAGYIILKSLGAI